jgi:hypothetical protein
MASLDALISSLNTVAKSLEKTVTAILVDKEKNIVQVVQHRLLNSGEDANGNLIGGGQYADMTIRHKLFTNQPTEHFTLFDEGDFHKGMFVENKGGVALIGSSDSKTGDLTSRYGEAILGLTSEETEQVVKLWVDPELQKIFNKIKDVTI